MAPRAPWPCTPSQLRPSASPHLASAPGRDPARPATRTLIDAGARAYVRNVEAEHASHAQQQADEIAAMLIYLKDAGMLDGYRFAQLAEARLKGESIVRKS